MTNDTSGVATFPIPSPIVSPHYSDVLSHFRGPNLRHFLCCLPGFPPRCRDLLFALRICWLINSYEIFWTALEKFRHSRHFSVPPPLFLFDFGHCSPFVCISHVTFWLWVILCAKFRWLFELCKLFACGISTGVLDLVYTPFIFLLIAAGDSRMCAFVGRRLMNPYLFYGFVFSLSSFWRVKNDLIEVFRDQIYTELIDTREWLWSINMVMKSDWIEWMRTNQDGFSIGFLMVKIG